MNKMKNIKRKIIEAKRNKLYEEYAKLIREIKLTKPKEFIKK